ncbi:MAG: HAD hydrolase-like protein [Phycisphaerales bacterium]|nr:MAG: HAD hydrolase-like protein [Phycisphaerales bacterium]
MDMPNERKVFLSHAESDKGLAGNIQQLLENVSHGMIRVWRSSSSGGIPPGANIWEKIHEELGEAARIVVVLTPVSCARPWLLWEAAYVAGLGRRQVIPLLCGVDRQDIPDPLRVFSCYSAGRAEELSELLTQLLTGLGLTPTAELVENCVDSFGPKLADYVANLPVGLKMDQSGSRPSSTHPDDPVFEPRKQFSNHLIEHLSDASVRTIQLITYTSEVNYAFLNQFTVEGKKTIEVYKRSVLADLAEQQEYNLKRLQAGVSVRRWDKRRVAVEASESLLRDPPKGSTITQYMYVGPPTKRAYVFDDHAAIVAYYETKPDPLETGGSVYKGITDLPAVWITRESKLGRFLLDELASFMAAVKMNGRSWNEERRILLEGAPWRGEGRRPCVEPRAVFLDLDGVLYDSLRNYVEAWQAAFGSVGVELPEDEVYRQEGRRGKETISAFLSKSGWADEDINDELVEQVYAIKAKEMERLGNPHVQRGAKRLVKAIAATGMEMWVVTGSSHPATTERVESDFDGLIAGDHIITGEDVRAGKPDADPFLLACHRAGVHSHESVVIENAPLGIESADRAGTFCIAINTGILADSELEAAGARVVFESCEKLAEVWNTIVEILRE